MDLVFHPKARAEFQNAVDWYEDRDDVVGTRFEQSVRSALHDVTTSPGSWPAWPGIEGVVTARSRRTAGFPYRVVYTVHDEQVIVLAVAHTSRRPGYWLSRLS
ncbi:type II toxin-antitoxin system RelE/ParE family toxin [Brevibacterium litoralis]|uniref:type II toxin-antitoxin system RelE/ParE family toxin n=1 Tax=Brevibacterium litoralis TaxID=3138935 RepID=UPI0032EB70FB